MPDAAEFLLINNNNSRTKFALASGDGLIADSFRVLDTAGTDAETVGDLIGEWSWERVVLASVVPEKAALLRLMFAEPVIEVTHTVELGIAVQFPNPETIGADRLANAVAVGRGPAIVVDFGTAVTFDIIDRQPAYIGGVIAPGLDSMRDYLHDRTALLPRINLKEPPAAIGKSTVDAMLSGAVHGYRGLVREILMQITHEMNEHDADCPEPEIIATGGHAELIAAGLPEIERIEPQLTLDGLRIIGNLNRLA